MLQMLAGPILRRVTAKKVAIWFATSEEASLSLRFQIDGQALSEDISSIAEHTIHLIAGRHLHFYLLEVSPQTELPENTKIYYDLKLNGLGWQDWASDLVYPDEPLPFFVYQPKVRNLLHGSCRKPHYESGDGLCRADDLLKALSPEDWPSLLMLSGDQIYADDVAGPMLSAIHQLIAKLEFAPETLPCIEVADSEQLHQQSPFYYAREQLLPADERSQNMLSKVFSGVRKPIFTSDSAQNHLITLAECLSMYLMVWSPTPWQWLGTSAWAMPENLSDSEQRQFQQQLAVIQSFVEGLPKVRRLMAHLPTAMMFDDHDVTDDWNLSAAWEQAAYEHPFSNRIIGNALISYLICQGWGNAPEHFSREAWQSVQTVLDQPGTQPHDECIQELNRFAKWGYQWQTQPPLVVLDTRTQRWRSETNLANPSGLMDWEALSDLQLQLFDLESVILVSPAPMFGVKLIEGVQRVFTWFGQPLMVDAENWMAHPGAAHTLINLFRHPKTPKHFVILSGDVHYSFVYRIELRGQRRGPDVWQVTSSGIKNEFPQRLLDVFDRLNRWLYSPRSPLNWFTRRRKMKVVPYKPETAQKGERLLNASGIGWLQLDEDGSPKECLQLCANGDTVAFFHAKEEARWE